MNDNPQPPFNPIPLSPEFQLAAPGQTSQQQTENQQAKQTTGAKAKRPRKTRVVAEPAATCHVLTRWQRIKTKFAARIAQIDQETLKGVLLACGVTAAIATTVLLLVKILPTAVVLLALLGIGLVIAVWDRIRRFPFGF